MKDEEANPKLEKALSELVRDRIFVPPQKDQEMRRAIQEHFGTPATTESASAIPTVPEQSPRAGRKRKRDGYRTLQRWMPLAASLVIAAIMLHFSRSSVRDRADLNRDGRVDVVDALLQAELISAGKGQDVNGDKAIDESDIADIAQRAVDLERSGS